MEKNKQNCRVYFIGAGPGDPDLITVRGRELIENADIIIYTGSLVNERVIEYRKDDSVAYNSAGMNLEEIVGIITGGVEMEKLIARVHTGDPSIYGAVREQAELLEKHSIEYEIIPGVSSFTASAASLKREFTLPGVSQTIICTRLEGRTPVPEKENLELLASHRASMAIFLSTHMIGDVADKLMAHYSEDTPAAVVQRATWENEKIIKGKLKDIAAKVKDAGIKKTALILVGDFLGDEFERSKLYDKNFSHEFRNT